jgi:hypothetical protein
MAEELLKKWRWLLDYYQEVSVATRLMLKLLGVGEGAKLEEVVDVFEPWLTPEYCPTLWLLSWPPAERRGLGDLQAITQVRSLR